MSMVERPGFEPGWGIKTRRIYSPVHSTALPPLQVILLGYRPLEPPPGVEPRSPDPQSGALTIKLRRQFALPTNHLICG